MADDLEQVARLVTRAVRERLGEVSGEVLEVVVKEVVGAMSGARGVPAPSTPEPPIPVSAPAAPAPGPGPAGSFTTGRGVVVPSAPGGGLDSLQICGRCLELERAGRQNRAVITTTGSNRPGVVATVAGTIASAGGDIQDMSQTLVAGFFTMIMVVDISSLAVPFEQFQQQLAERARELGIHAVVMHEAVLHALQRV